MASQNHILIPDRPYASYKAYLSAQGPLSEVWKQSDSEILQNLLDSGLRGRGGAGFPTGQKWQTLFSHSCSTRDVVCNAAEGEPGTFKDRFLLRKNPYPTLEGMAIACKVIKARAAYIAIKASFTQEINVLKRAIAEVRAAGLFRETPLHLVEGPEEYLFGEEKALLNVIENEGPFPRTPEEPPYEVGLFATVDSPNPALVNNVQTFAHVASIARFGAASFRETGTEDTPGTLLFTLCGDIRKPGVYEAEAGLSLEEVVMRFGGGVKGKRVKAVLPGVAAAVILPKQLKTATEFGAMRKIGTGLGAAGFIVIADTTPMLEILRAVTRFLYVESCNQCSACKAGLRIAWEGLEEVKARKAGPYDWDRIREAAEGAPQGNRCYLPVQASHLIPSLLKHFAKELHRPLRASQEWPIPKILDFDEAKREFIYDPKQSLKQPDWTYAEPEEAGAGGAP